MTPLFLVLACTQGGELPLDLALEDVNPRSATYGEQVVLGDVGDAATAWYFTHAT